MSPGAPVRAALAALAITTACTRPSGAPPSARARVVDTGHRAVAVTDRPPARATPPATPPTPTIPPEAVAYEGSFPAAPGAHVATLTVAGLSREVALHVPARRGEHPPLVLCLHGTNGSGATLLDDSGARALADAEGVIAVAPTSRWRDRGDWDHRSEETYWETFPNADPERNPDLALVRAALAEAARRYAVDPARVYVLGHSNGGFFAALIAHVFRDRVAGFAVSSAGLVACENTWSCGFQGSGSACSALAAQRGWCRCEGPEKPAAFGGAGRRPAAYITHGTRDPMVSVYYACALEARLRALGHPVEVSLRDGDGHSLPERFARDAWTALSAHRIQ